MNIYKATSDICDTILFSLKWNKHSFGLRLAKLREAAGISARQMSLDLGLNKNYINSIESGKNYPALEGFFNICDYLHVDPFTFFYTDDNTYQSFAYFIPLLQKLNSEDPACLSDGQECHRISIPADENQSESIYSNKIIAAERNVFT